MLLTEMPSLIATGAAGPRTCAELLHAAVYSSCSACGQSHYHVSDDAPAFVAALRGFAGVDALPQAAYVSLLRCSLAHSATAIEMLKMPQGQHITAGDLCNCLTTAMRKDGAKVMRQLLK